MFWFKNLIRNTTLTSSSLSLLKSKHNVSTNYSILTSLSHFTSRSSPFSSSVASSTAPVTLHSGLGPTKADEKPRLVVLGSGWAGCRLMKGIDTKLYDIVCVSPRNHMVFTPLLASTCVGTLEFRSVAEPIGRIQPAISKEPGSYFFLANCIGVDVDNHSVIWWLLNFKSFVFCFFCFFVFCFLFFFFGGVDFSTL